MEKRGYIKVLKPETLHSSAKYNKKMLLLNAVIIVTFTTLSAQLQLDFDKLNITSKEGMARYGIYIPLPRVPTRPPICTRVAPPNCGMTIAEDRCTCGESSGAECSSGQHCYFNTTSSICTTPSNCSTTPTNTPCICGSNICLPDQVCFEFNCISPTNTLCPLLGPAPGPCQCGSNVNFKACTVGNLCIHGAEPLCFDPPGGELEECPSGFPLPQAERPCKCGENTCGTGQRCQIANKECMPTYCRGGEMPGEGQKCLCGMTNCYHRQTCNLTDFNCYPRKCLASREVTEFDCLCGESGDPDKVAMCKVGQTCDVNAFDYNGKICE